MTEAERRWFAELVDERTTAAGIPERFRHAEHPDAGRLAEAVRSGRSLFVHGDVGTGKTHLACAVARILVADGARVRFRPMYELLDEIRAGYDTGVDPLPGYQTADVLVLDDLGKEVPTAWVLERLFALANARSGAMLPTIVTTQYSGGRLVERLSGAGDVDTAKAIVSRLREDSEAIHLAGGDRRIR